jgi:hypothetical protein
MTLLIWKSAGISFPFGIRGQQIADVEEAGRRVDYLDGHCIAAYSCMLLEIVFVWQAVVVVVDRDQKVDA